MRNIIGILVAMMFMNGFCSDSRDLNSTNINIIVSKIDADGITVKYSGIDFKFYSSTETQSWYAVAGDVVKRTSVLYTKNLNDKFKTLELMPNREGGLYLKAEESDDFPNGPCSSGDYHVVNVDTGEITYKFTDLYKERFGSSTMFFRIRYAFSTTKITLDVGLYDEFLDAVPDDNYMPEIYWKTKGVKGDVEFDTSDAVCEYWDYDTDEVFYQPSELRLGHSYWVVMECVRVYVNGIEKYDFEFEENLSCTIIVGDPAIYSN